MDFQHIFSAIPDIATACLAILGGLKVIARYTATEADDKVLAAIEKPFSIVLDFFRRK